MTIIEPNKKVNLKYFFILIFLTIVFGSLTYIYEYNRLVDSRFEVRNFEKSIVKYQTINAELKNELYKKLDPSLLQEIASKKGFVIEKYPKYITKN